MRARFGRLHFGLLLPLAACLDEAPPRDFRVVPAATPRFAGDECPDLSGLAIGSPDVPVVSAAMDRPAPETHGLPVVLAFRRGTTQQEMWWVVPRPMLLQFARELRARDPLRYARWRALVVRSTLPGARAWDTEGYLKELAPLGPPGRVFAGVVNYSCKAGWTQVRPFSVVSSGEGYTQRELWLARDERGDLLVRDMRRRMKPFHVWGDATNFFRVGNASTWQRLRTVNPGSVDALTESELPGGAPARPADASAPDAAPACRAALTLVNELSQRLASGLPAGVTLAGFRARRAPASPVERLADECEPVMVEVELDGPSSQALDGVHERLLAEGSARRVEIAATTIQAGSVRRQVRVTLQ